jgi:hypothetical protein
MSPPTLAAFLPEPPRPAGACSAPLGIRREEIMTLAVRRRAARIGQGDFISWVGDGGNTGGCAS